MKRLLVGLVLGMAGIANAASAQHEAGLFECTATDYAALHFDRVAFGKAVVAVEGVVDTRVIPLERRRDHFFAKVEYGQRRWRERSRYFIGGTEDMVSYRVLFADGTVLETVPTRHESYEVYESALELVQDTDRTYLLSVVRCAGE